VELVIVMMMSALTVGSVFSTTFVLNFASRNAIVSVRFASAPFYTTILVPDRHDAFGRWVGAEVFIP